MRKVWIDHIMKYIICKYYICDLQLLLFSSRYKCNRFRKKQGTSFLSTQLYYCVWWHTGWTLIIKLNWPTFKIKENMVRGFSNLSQSRRPVFVFWFPVKVTSAYLWFFTYIWQHFKINLFKTWQGSYSRYCILNEVYLTVYEMRD